MAFFLAFKEIWRNKGRFFLFSLVIALITSLVLFIAALAQGLSNANKEYLIQAGCGFNRVSEVGYSSPLPPVRSEGPSSITLPVYREWRS